MGDENGREIFSALDDAYDSNQSESEVIAFQTAYFEIQSLRSLV